jgi:hypothetical protein
MSILTSVSDVLALLAAGAALIAATRALQVAGRLARGPATTVQPPAVQAEPIDSAPPAKPATASRTSGTPVAAGTARGNELREQIRAFLADRPGQELSLVHISQGVGRSSATVSYALDKLVQAGEVELTSPKPRRYTITPSGTTAHQPQPLQEAAEAEPAAGPEPTPAGEHQAPAERPSRTRPRAGTPATADAAGNGGGGRGRGAETREQVRAFLADPERVGSDWSLVQVSQGVGRSSATVSYALDKLIQAGEVALTSPKPRRYTIAASGTGPAVAAGQAAEPTGDEAAASHSGQVAAARARSGRARGRRAATVDASAPTPPAAGTSRSRGGNRKATAAAATRNARPAAATAAK